MEKSIKTIENFAYYLEREFLQEHDYANIRGESNVIRYLHVRKMTLVISSNDSLLSGFILTCIAILLFSKVGEGASSEAKEIFKEVREKLN